MKKNIILKFLFPSIIVLSLIIGLILYPQDSISAAQDGLSIWVNVLIPSLLPFIIGASLLVNLKVVDIIGLFINPITQKIFNVSGKGSLVFAMSTFSGYPVGTKLASELREKGELTKYEAQRLVSFCSTSGPLFMIGAVAIGMFNNSNIGYFIALCHYLGSITVGILFRNYGNEKSLSQKLNISNELKRIIKSKINDKDGFYTIFGEAVYSGLNTILMVGGFVIIFSVVFKIFSLLGIISTLANIIYLPLSLFGVSKDLTYAFISGLFEITIGCNNIAAVTDSPLVIKLALSVFVISFSGLSILAQCNNFLAKTDINVHIYTFSKFLHGVFGFIYCLILYPLFKHNFSMPTFSIYETIYRSDLWLTYIYHYKVILPILFIIYIVSTLYIVNKEKAVD